MLEEVGLPYIVRLVDITAGAQFSSDFLTVSPNNKIPALIDDDGAEGRRVLFESGAILLYLAEKTGKLLASSGGQRDDALSWLFWGTTGLGPVLGRFMQQADVQNDTTRSDPRGQEVTRLMHVLEKRLNELPYLATVYSVADIAAFAWIKFALPTIMARLSEQLGSTPGIARWFESINARSAVIRGLRAPKIRLHQRASDSE